MSIDIEVNEMRERISARVELLKESAVHPLRNEFPIVEAIDELSELANAVCSAWSSFSRLCDKIYNDLLNESYDGLIGIVRERLSEADDAIVRLGRIIPPDFKNDLNIDAIASKVKLLSSQLDSGVSLANNSIYELIQSDEWTRTIPSECRTLYMKLMERTSDFCVFALRFGSNLASAIRKTKSIFGKQINPDAKAPSATELDRTYDWITYEQFQFGMKSTDLKKIEASV